MIIFIIGLMLALIALLIYVASLEDECARLRYQIARLKMLDPSMRPCGQGHIPVDDWS